RSNGDLRAVTRLILTSPEFYAPPAYRAKVKSPFEFVVSVLRATDASVTNIRALAGTIANLGEPLYQCQPPTGYGDRSTVWVNTGTLLSRLNFAQALVANGMGAAKVNIAALNGAPDRLAAELLANDLSDQSRVVLQRADASPVLRTTLLLGSPE